MPDNDVYVLVDLFAVGSQVAVESQLRLVWASAVRAGKLSRFCCCCCLPPLADLTDAGAGGSSQSCHVHALSMHTSQFGHVSTSPSALRGYQHVRC